MTVLIVVGVLVGLFILAVVVMAFNEYCDAKFDHAFFTKPMLILLGVAAGLFIWGLSWYETDAATAKGYTWNGIIFTKETLNGLALMGISILIYLSIAIYNFVVTNWIYGFFGTIMQFSILTVAAYFGFVLIVGYFGIMIMLSMMPRRY
ncbi:hypothetical protein [Wohlfahrtiimonas chitiniclastica]|uniref:hypothetical protein n=1 Tax=Wohlfahrtiimonas chitiniclastica TaxID=400946 RepID=UPI0007B69A8A|nr:hypothetical protein [Wohlfahrtiimonas chitiniclastica]KZX38231.1 hypothetical protein A6V30_04950 [Wohlfahrtiimonas chitiniclastica]